MARDLLNLFRPGSGTGESLTPLLTGGAFRLEQIVSRGEPSPPGFFYDQREDEWVVLVQGTATLEFADGERLGFEPGDCLRIEAHDRHRVSEVSDDAIWLAVHFVPVRPAG